MDCDTLTFSGLPEDLIEDAVKNASSKFGRIASFKFNSPQHTANVKFYNPISANRAYYGLKEEMISKGITIVYEA